MRGWVVCIILASACGMAVACGSDDAGNGSNATGGGAGLDGSAASGGTGGSSSGGNAGFGGSAGFGGTAGSIGAAGSGGSAGSSGSAGSAGSAGFAGNAGFGGSAGFAGSAGSATDASTDSDPGDAPNLPLPGFGAITGDCGPIDPTELTSPNPFDFQNHIDFATMPFSYAALSIGGKEVFDDGNLGGSSLYSEIFSYEVLYRCELATLLKTESEVVYTNAGGKKTDLLVQIDGYKIGVSVTRAYAFPPGSTYTLTQAQSLLEGKLADILLSTANVSAGDAWTKQILHVLAYNDQHKDAVFQAYAQIAPATKADSIVLVTVTDGDDAFVY